MSLINCPECGKEISDKAASCPNCGNPINKGKDSEEYLCCPKCMSKELHAEQKGFSGGKALTGVLLTGGIGLLAGTIGSKNVQITCLKCGNKFKAGDAMVVNKESEEIDNELKNIIESKGMLAAVKYYNDKTGLGIAKSKAFVDSYADKYHIVPNKTNNGGCAGVLFLFLLVFTSIFLLTII
jgi:endogenous inhibitor of DNA gyrase (YacG/DUF329 family)